MLNSLGALVWGMVGAEVISALRFSGLAIGSGMVGLSTHKAYKWYHENIPFDIKRDWIRHIHYLGTTGVGKTTDVFNVALRTINEGHGILWLDPEGDKPNSTQPASSDELLELIPPHRIQDVVYFDPTDKIPIGFNILDFSKKTSANDINIITENLVKVYKNTISATGWGVKIENGIKYATMAVMEYGKKTKTQVDILDPYRLIMNEEYRDEVEKHVTNFIVKDWLESFKFEKDDGEMTGDAKTLQYKLGTPLLNSYLLECLCQPSPKFDLVQAINENKIIIIKLGGRFGENASILLSSIIFTHFIQLAYTGQIETKFFQFFADECQFYVGLLGKSFESVLARVRKYNIGLVFIHQYLKQLTPSLQSAMRLCGTKFYFKTPDPDDAGDIMKMFCKADKEKFPLDLIMNLAERCCIAIELKHGITHKPKLKYTQKAHFREVTSKELVKMSDKERIEWSTEKKVYIETLKEFSRGLYGSSRDDVKQYIAEKMGQLGREYIDGDYLEEVKVGENSESDTEGLGYSKYFGEDSLL